MIHAFQRLEFTQGIFNMSCVLFEIFSGLVTRKRQGMACWLAYLLVCMGNIFYLQML